MIMSTSPLIGFSLYRDWKDLKSLNRLRESGPQPSPSSAFRFIKISNADGSFDRRKEDSQTACAMASLETNAQRT